MRVAIVRYNAGNTASVANSLRRLGVEPEITDQAEALTSADRVIFPGVGEASTAMAYLRERKLDAVIRALEQPVLGICLGMQLMCSESEENSTECLGIVPNRVRRFGSPGHKVPHIGWSKVGGLERALFNRVADEEYFYFVHGYYVELGDDTIGTCEHGELFSAALSFRNFHAVQFHPEKSGTPGRRMLENFLNL